MTKENETINDVEKVDPKPEETAAAPAPETEVKPMTDAELIGKVCDGSVTHITAFGAFVKLDNGEEGLVHISEIANEFVTEVTNFVTLGATIQVKVLARNPKGKLDLSMKKVGEEKSEKPTLFLKHKTKNDDFESKMNQFLKKSEEKQIDIRRNLKQKQGIVKRKK